MNISGNVVDVFPHIFKRPFIPIVLDTPLYQFSVFLAIGPEIYVDGLVVLEKNNQQVVGRLGCRNILSHLLNTRYSEWRSTTADQIVEKIFKEEEMINIDSPVSKVIELFKKTKFAFTPITKDGNVVAILTIRDFLPIVKNKDNAETTPISQISSKLTSIDKNTDVLKTIDIMLKKGIRNIGITKNKNKKSSEVIGVINDRKILEFLLSYTGRQIMKDLEQKTISHIKLIRLTENLDIYPIREVHQDLSIKAAANLLTEMERPFLILEGKDKIVTPWDIVMKTF